MSLLATSTAAAASPSPATREVSRGNPTPVEGIVGFDSSPVAFGVVSAAAGCATLAAPSEPSTAVPSHFSISRRCTSVPRASISHCFVFMKIAPQHVLVLLSSTIKTHRDGNSLHGAGSRQHTAGSRQRAARSGQQAARSTQRLAVSSRQVVGGRRQLGGGCRHGGRCSMCRPSLDSG